MTIYDIDLAASAGVWTPALTGRTRPARDLLRAFNQQVKGAAGTVVHFGLRKGAGALHTVFGSQFGNEVDELAALLDQDPADIILANCAYDLSHAAGCSTFVSDTPEGPLHARNLDWTFPGGLLRRHTSVMRVHNAPGGFYATVGWPGLFGVLTGVAPGRFAVTVNHVTHSAESTKLGVAARAAKGHWPVSWAVRNVFDTARNFDAAVRQLRSVALIAPVLFTVSGIHDGEGVVIERSVDGSSIRRFDGPAVCVSNHYTAPRMRGFNVDLDETDSRERLEHLDVGVASVEMSPARALRLLTHRQLLKDDTQHQVVMWAAEGYLAVRVPGQRVERIQLTM